MIEISFSKFLSGNSNQHAGKEYNGSGQQVLIDIGHSLIEQVRNTLDHQEEFVD